MNVDGVLLCDFLMNLLLMHREMFSSEKNVMEKCNGMKRASLKI
jgi:hypothetical protein